MMHLLKSLVGNLRGHSQLGVVSSIDDTGQAQTANLSTGTGVNRAAVEVGWPFGFSSVPPGDGMIGLVVAIGGDPSNLMVHPVGNPSARFGGLLVGEAVIYGADGSRVHVRNGSIEIWSSNVKVFGNLTVDGSITATGNITAGEGTGDQVDVKHHTHTYIPGTGAATPTSAPIAGT